MAEHPASDISATGGDHVFSSADDNVQKALDTIDVRIPVVCAIGLWDPNDGMPPSPHAGDRYVSIATAGGWHINLFYTYDGSNWIEGAPSVYQIVFLLSDRTLRYWDNDLDCWCFHWATVAGSGHEDELLAADNIGDIAFSGISKGNVVTADAAGTDNHVPLFDGAGKKIKDSSRVIVTAGGIGSANGVPALDGQGLLSSSMLPASSALPLAGGTMTGRVVDLSYLSKREPVSDQDYAVGGNFVGTIAYVTITAQRLVTLPNAATYPGLRLRIVDATTHATNHAGTYPIRVQSAGGTIGIRTEITLNQRNGAITVESDGSNWQVDGGTMAWLPAYRWTCPADIRPATDDALDDNFDGVAGNSRPGALSLGAVNHGTKISYSIPSGGCCLSFAHDGTSDVVGGMPFFRGFNRTWASPPSTYEIRVDFDLGAIRFGAYQGVMIGAWDNAASPGPYIWSLLFFTNGPSGWALQCSKWKTQGANPYIFDSGTPTSVPFYGNRIVLAHKRLANNNWEWLFSLNGQDFAAINSAYGTGAPTAVGFGLCDSAGLPMALRAKRFWRFA